MFRLTSIKLNVNKALLLDNYIKGDMRVSDIDNSINTAVALYVDMNINRV